jgi:hypothetical protein
MQFGSRLSNKDKQVSGLAFPLAGVASSLKDYWHRKSLTYFM